MTTKKLFRATQIPTKEEKFAREKEEAKLAVKACLRGCRSEEDALKRLAAQKFRAEVVPYRDDNRKLRFTVIFKVPGQKKVACVSS